MTNRLVVVGLAVALVACTSADPAQPAANSAPSAVPASNASIGVGPVVVMRTNAFAALPDRGDLIDYLPPAPRREGPSSWHRADVSEEHALRAIVTGELKLATPKGQALAYRYRRHVEHANGNWTWVGILSGFPDRQAIITFGERATFGLFGRPGAEPLQLTVRDGVAWMVEVAPRAWRGVEALGGKQDYLLPQQLVKKAAAEQSATAMLAGTAGAGGPTVDVALGYTAGFATSLGGQSQAVTRLTHLVSITNEAYASSNLNAQLRLVRTLQVNYPDNTSNNTALDQLTGSTGSDPIPIPASLQPLRQARDQYGADLVSLVRKFNEPENEGCGIAWLLGGGGTAITSSDAPWGYSVVSDGSDGGFFCRTQTLAHELGHNMGQSHNVEDTDGDSGAHPYSYGYREASATGFYTIMAYRAGDTQYSIAYFANPNVRVDGRPTGVANASDNVRSMALTIPVIASFRATVVASPYTAPDLYAIARQGVSLKTEVHALNGASGLTSFLFNRASALGRTGSGNDWDFRVGDYNADGAPDLYAIKKMGASGRTEVHVLNGASGQFGSFLVHVATVMGQAGTDNRVVFDLGDYNKDGKLDVYVINRQGTSGKTEVHILNGANNYQSYLLHRASALGHTGTDNSWMFELGDFNRDGRLDVYGIKRQGASGKTEVHVLNGADGFQTFLTHRATGLGLTGTGYSWDFKLGHYNGDSMLDIYVIKKQGTSGKTEAHVLNGADGFQTYLAHIATGLGATGSDGSWDFDIPAR